MRREQTEDFDVFRHRDQQKKRKNAVRRRQRIVQCVIRSAAFGVSVVLVMNALGGTRHFSEWRLLKRYLTAVERGNIAPESRRKFLSLTKSIPRCRGNHSALAGLYCVDALQGLSEGRCTEAATSLGILEKEFASERLFSRHWDTVNLMQECTACKTQKRTCRACKGSGKVVGLTSGLRDSRKGKKRMTTSSRCIACSGRGEIMVTSSGSQTRRCKTCGGGGTAILQEAVEKNRAKALTKAKAVVTLKCAQSVLSLRTVPWLSAAAKRRAQDRPDMGETMRKSLTEKLDAILSQRQAEHAALVAEYQASIRDVIAESHTVADLSSVAASLDDATEILPNALIMEPRFKEQNSEFMRKLETQKAESSAAEKALYDTYLAQLSRLQSVGRLPHALSSAEMKHVKSDLRYQAAQFENELHDAVPNCSQELGRLKGIWNREQLKLDVEFVRCENAVHAKYTSELGKLLTRVQKSGDLNAWESINNSHQSALATNDISSVEPRESAALTLYDQARRHLVTEKEKIDTKRQQLSRLYVRHLEQLCRKLVIDGNIKQARAVRQQIKHSELTRADNAG